MTSAVVDNDILIKLSAYRLLGEGVGELAAPADVGVLGAATYVVPAALMGKSRVADRTGARVAWEALAATFESLEPTPTELELAARVEEQAARRGLPLDTGESQLLAICVLRSITKLATGDKRAVAAMEDLRGAVAELQALDETVICLEQIVERLALDLGSDTVRSKVCAEAKVDRALSICMGCSSISDRREIELDGLTSYVEDMRRRAPSVLGSL